MSDKLYLITQAQLDMLARALITGEGEDPDLATTTATWAQINAKADRPHKEGQIIAKTLTELTAEDLKGVTTIGSDALKEQFELTSLNLTGIETIGAKACYGCLKLSSLSEIDSLKIIGAYAFFCTGLTELPLGEVSTLTYIGDYAFEGCNSLVLVYLPASLEYIGYRSFQTGSSSLQIELAATNAPTLSDASAFNTDYTTIFIPAGSLVSYAQETNWSSIKHILFEKDSNAIWVENSNDVRFYLDGITPGTSWAQYITNNPDGRLMLETSTEKYIQINGDGVGFLCKRGDSANPVMSTEEIDIYEWYSIETGG